MDDITKCLTLVFVLFILGIGSLAYSGIVTQHEMKDVKIEVFTLITNNSTNKEIIEQIHESCGKTSWFVDKTGCESILLNSFVTPTKN